MIMSSVRIVIVGAGMAGICAAERLLKNGFRNVQILEGSPRVGGRVHTRSHDQSVIEIGAQWIHGEDCNPIFNLAQDNRLCGQTPPRKSSLFYTSSGSELSPDVAAETCDVMYNILDEARKICLEEHSTQREEEMGSFIETAFDEHLRGCSDSAEMKEMKALLFKWRMKIENEKNACSSMNELSVASWGEYTTYTGNETVELGCHGYQAVIDVILKDIPQECLHLNTRVKEIIWGDTPDLDDLDPGSLRCNVVTDNGDVIEADHVIVTCSLGFLKVHSTRLFNPPLPECKMSSIKRLSYGTVNKIYLHFDEPFWSQDCGGMHFIWLPRDNTTLNSINQCGSSNNNAWFKAIHGFDVVARQTHVLCGWIAGEEAVYMESLSDDLVLDVCHELLQIFTGRDDIPRPSQIIMTRWHEDEFSLGSYSYHPKGASVADVANLSKPLPSESYPWLLFAGEATDPMYFSTTHGAMLSGQREADRITQRYSSPSKLLQD